ncbi:hypothetical protein ABVK25_011608 [Lepraria finkii]|uniref:Uncharacterized protein n=1 Tax=Lepraria finkii TaxID=1340010 RepID=A0ABR4ALR8_9LECA
MAATQQQPNIWAQMEYVPPRGPCSQKTSMVSSCACYRFMIHPLKVATSFDCDGCGHHASFHRMESKEEEEIVRRWKVEETSRENAQARVQEVFESVAPKRRRIADVPEEILEWVAEERVGVGKRPAVVAKGRGGAAKGTKRKDRD